MKSLKEIDLKKLSPMMQQYLIQKQEHPDCLLLFRLGDFYELFFDDALIASEVLEIALTARDCGLEEKAPMCGVPWHSAQSYIAKLIEASYKVAISEQMEDPSASKGIVRREVVRIITPGTVTDYASLDENRNHYLASIVQEGSSFAYVQLELISGKFSASLFSFGDTSAQLLDLLDRYNPPELLVNKEFFQKSLNILEKPERFVITQKDEDYFILEEAKAFFVDLEFSNRGFDSNLSKHLILKAASGLLHYLQETQGCIPEHTEKLSLEDLSASMRIPKTTRRNLELFETLSEGKRQGSLIWSIDYCKTAMGRRLLRSWLEAPLISESRILWRQEAVAELKEQFILRNELREAFRGVGDLERLSGKLGLGSINARELKSLAFILSRLPLFKERLANVKSEALQNLRDSLSEEKEFCERLEKALTEDPPITLKEGGLIKRGFNEALDSLKDAAEQGQTWLVNLESKMREETGIKNLKLGYNRVFGYYFEVSKGNLSMVPDTFIRKQTLVNSERFFTETLKAMEGKILGAKSRLLNLEYELFVELREEAKQHIAAFKKNADAMALLDVLAGLAELADREDFVCPQIESSRNLFIKDGRHPVLSKLLGRANFVSNDLQMEEDETSMFLITGPNMGGKSTYMRQTALIVLLAQIGSFVPASACRIGICDALYTRIGASDDLSSGRSTFLVEMSELAQILNETSPNALIILDEIGRGTGTQDGLSIAWAVIEALLDEEIYATRTLFATHYHELSALEKRFSKLKNFHVSISEENNEITFLHKIKRGVCNESYGVDVAKLAGVPELVVHRARTLLKELKVDAQKKTKRSMQKQEVMDGQMDLFRAQLAFEKNNNVLSSLRTLDLNSLTPIEALQFLYELKKELEDSERLV